MEERNGKSYWKKERVKEKLLSLFCRAFQRKAGMWQQDWKSEREKEGEGKGGLSWRGFHFWVWFFVREGGKAEGENGGVKRRRRKSGIGKYVNVLSPFQSGQNWSLERKSEKRRGKKTKTTKTFKSFSSSPFSLIVSVVTKRKASLFVCEQCDSKEKLQLIAKGLGTPCS